MEQAVRDIYVSLELQSSATSVLSELFGKKSRDLNVAEGKTSYFRYDFWDVMACSLTSDLSKNTVSSYVRRKFSDDGLTSSNRTQKFTNQKMRNFNSSLIQFSPDHIPTIHVW